MPERLSTPDVARRGGVARMRARGHPPAEVREASAAGRLAYRYIEDLFPEPDQTHTFEHIGEVKLKGFNATTDLFLARARGEEPR